MTDRTIIDRVRYAQGIIDQAVDRNDAATELADLLGDLMHWAQAVGVDFTEAVEQAAQHFDAEDAGTDVPTLSQKEYRAAFGAGAAKRRRERVPGGGGRCSWCNALVKDHTAAEREVCTRYEGIPE